MERGGDSLVIPQLVEGDGGSAMHTNLEGGGVLELVGRAGMSELTYVFFVLLVLLLVLEVVRVISVHAALSLVLLRGERRRVRLLRAAPADFEKDVADDEALAVDERLLLDV